MPLQPDTLQIHHPYVAPSGWEAVPVGVYKASTVLFKDTAALHQQKRRDLSSYTYGLHGTPTTYTLAARVASLEGGQHAVLVPSGLAAITVVNLGLLSHGDEVLMPDNIYGNNKEQAAGLLRRMGIRHQVYDPSDLPALAKMMTPATRLVWLEAAGSITMEFPDLLGIIKLCRERGVLVALDNTWGAGVAFNPFELPGGSGVDVSMHALTKYPSGGADVLMGAVVTRDEALFARINEAHMQLGFGVSANDAELVLRSLPTMHLRYARHDQTALALAKFMANRHEVAQVLHPALPGSPGHAHWAEVCCASAGLFSVVFKQAYSPAQVDAFVDALKLFGIGYSWAGPMSLAVPYSLKHTRQFARPDTQGTLVRFAIGLESVEDLRADIEQALQTLA